MKSTVVVSSWQIHYPPIIFKNIWKGSQRNALSIHGKMGQNQVRQSSSLDHSAQCRNRLDWDSEAEYPHTWFALCMEGCRASNFRNSIPDYSNAEPENPIENLRACLAREQLRAARMGLAILLSNTIWASTTILLYTSMGEITVGKTVWR